MSLRYSGVAYFSLYLLRSFQNLVNYNRTLLLTLLGFFLAFGAVGQGATDCRDFIVVCGPGNLSLNSNGVGINDFANPKNISPDCGFGETQSLWLKIPIAANGTLEFAISSNNNVDDFDFAVYGPNVSCDSLGRSIRCSSTHPPSAGTPAVTGLRPGENENSDGPGALGNGFVDPLSVRAGEEYIILIDNFDQTNAGFDLEWGGSAVISPPPVTNLVEDVMLCDASGARNPIMDLSEQANAILGSQTGVDISFFSSEADALLSQNGFDPSAVTIINGRQVIFAKLTNVSDGCTTITSFLVEVNPDPVLEPITGPASVCPTVTGIPYRTQGTDVDSYVWFVEGGNITSGQGTTDILVDWGNTNDNAMVKVVGKTGNGCVSDTTFFPVRVNRRLEPETPVGLVQVCYNERLSTRYEVPLVPGSIYEWGVINGSIEGANDKNTIEVNWDGFTGTGRVFFREFNPGIAECEGFSDTLDVQLLTEILVNAQVTEPLCSGADNGRIQLTVSGGAIGAVDFTWDDVTTNTDLRENLPPGTYNYSISDQVGCLQTGSVTIMEPPPISLINVIPVDASCFQSSDGGILATVTGGTGSYRYSINGQTIPLDRDQIEIRNLPRGTYNLDMLDDNDCMFTFPFTVAAPELLEADLQSLLVIDACPQQATGAISFEAMGGTPDYTFTWLPNIGQDGNAVTDLNRGDYTVTIADMNNCQANLTVTVREVQPRVQVPNAFSPNSDSENDLFQPLSNCPLGNYRFSVFNRWGSLVFSTTDQNAGWDGNLEGKPAPTGRYSYLVSYTILLEDVLVEESLRGVVRIFR